MTEEIGYMGKYLQSSEPRFTSRLLRLFNPSAIITTQKRFPDVSFYQGNINFDIMRGSTDTVIIRAGQNEWVDTKFYRNWSEAKRVGMKRGSYWFYDDRKSPATQANIYINLLKSDPPEMETITDWENTYGGPYNKLSHVTDFIKQVEDALGLPVDMSAMYTGYYWFRDHAMSSEFGYLKTKSLWLGWYTNNPANVLIPAPWTKLTHWQFGTPVEGRAYGTETNEIDMNYFNGTVAEFNTRYNTIAPPLPTDDVLLFEREYFPGAIERQYRTITTHGEAIYNLTEVEIAKVEKFFVSPQLSSRQYVPKFLEDYDLHFAINCDGWTSPPLVPTGYNASEGQPYGVVGNEETVYIGKDNSFSLVRPSIVWNAFSFQNRLIKDGIIPVINKALDDIRARTAIGYTQAQDKVYLLTIDGGDQYSREGLNFQETAAVLLNLGCYQGFMLDGGGSTAKVVEDHGVKIIGLPSGEDLVVQYGAQLRRVLNVFGLQMKDDAVVIPPTGDEMNYKVLIGVKPRKTPSMYETITKSNLAVGLEFASTVTQTINDPSRVDNGVTFVQMADTYWVPMIYKSVEYVKALDVVIPPLSVTYTATIKDDATGEIWSGTLTKQ